MVCDLKPQTQHFVHQLSVRIASFFFVLSVGLHSGQTTLAFNPPVVSFAGPKHCSMNEIACPCVYSELVATVLLQPRLYSSAALGWYNLVSDTTFLVCWSGSFQWNLVTCDRYR